MKIYSEESLSSFDFWSGARDNASKLTDDQFDKIEMELENEYPDGIGATELNDLFWFDFEYVCQLCGAVYDTSNDEVYSYDDFEAYDSERVIEEFADENNSILIDYLRNNDFNTIDELLEDGTYVDDVADDLIRSLQDSGDIFVNEEDSYIGNWYIIDKR